MSAAAPDGAPPPPWPAVDAVVLGASAGGVDALLRLVRALPAAFPAALLLVLHRQAAPPPAAASLAALLAARCALPVADAWDRQPIRRGEVLIAPADYHLLVDPGPVVSLSRDDTVLFARPAIDPLFETAAAVFGRRLLAVVLTGANDDGSRGAQAVRRAGGLVWVQDPGDAAVPTMPQAALARAGADAVLTLAQLGRRFEGSVQAVRER